MKKLISRTLSLFLLLCLASCYTSHSKLVAHNQQAQTQRHNQIESLVNSGSGSSEQYVYLANSYYSKQQYQKAYETTLKADTKGFYDERLQVLKLRALVALGDYQIALDESKSIRNETTRLSEQSNVFLLVGNLKESEKRVSKFVQKKSSSLPEIDFLKIHSVYATTLYRMGKKEKAKSIALKALERDQNNNSTNKAGFAHIKGSDPKRDNIIYSLRAVLAALYIEQEEFETANQMLLGKPIIGASLIERKKGLTVEHLVINSSAQLAGLRVGDIVLGINGVQFNKIKSPAYAVSIIQAQAIGSRLNISIKRNNEIKSIGVVKIVSPKLLTIYPKNYSLILENYKKKGRFNDYIDFLNKNPKADNKFEAAELALKKINRKSKDSFIKFAQLYRFVPEIESKIPEKILRQVKYMSIGPSHLNLAIISTQLKKGTSPSLLIAKINAVKEPYKDFSFDEIDDLKKEGITQEVIGAMISVTTKLEQEIAKQKEEELKKKSSQSQFSMQSTVAHNGEESSLAAEAASAVSDCIAKKAAEKACNLLPGLAGSACNMALSWKFDCPL